MANPTRYIETANFHEMTRRIPGAGYGGIFQYHAQFVPKALAFLAA